MHCGASLSELRVHRKCLGKRLGHKMYIMPVLVEECSMGVCMGMYSSWIVHTVLGVSNRWIEIQGGRVG